MVAVRKVAEMQEKLSVSICALNEGKITVGHDHTDDTCLPLRVFKGENKYTCMYRKRCRHIDVLSVVLRLSHATHTEKTSQTFRRSVNHYHWNIQHMYL